MDAAHIFSQTVDFNLGKLSFSPSFIQAGLIVVLLFLLVVMMAQFRRHLMGWSLKGGIFGMFIGFAIALIFEGFLIIGGKTAFTEIIGWQNAPKPIRVALEAGRAKLVGVLGASEEIPVSNAETPSSKEEVVQKYQSLPPDEAKSVRQMICVP
jgi:hypothetical protein